MAEEAFIMPSQSFKGNKLSAPESTFSCYRLGAGGASLGEELGEALGAVWVLLPGGEPLPRQRLAAVGAGEALPVVSLVTVGDAAARDHLSALDTLGCKLVLVAGGAVDLVLLGDEALGAYGVGAHAAYEALLVPLPGLVLHLLHPGPEHLSARVAPRRELIVVAVSAVDSVRLAPELLVHEAGAALGATETGLVPVLLFVGQILAVNPDHLPTVVTIVGERILIAADAEGVVIPQNIPVTGQTVIAVVAEQDLKLQLPVLVESVGVLLPVQTSVDKFLP